MTKLIKHQPTSKPTLPTSPTINSQTWELKHQTTIWPTFWQPKRQITNQQPKVLQPNNKLTIKLQQTNGTRKQEKSINQVHILSNQPENKRNK